MVNRRPKRNNAPLLRLACYQGSGGAHAGFCCAPLMLHAVLGAGGERSVTALDTLRGVPGFRRALEFEKNVMLACTSRTSMQLLRWHKKGGCWAVATAATRVGTNEPTNG